MGIEPLHTRRKNAGWQPEKPRPDLLWRAVSRSFTILVLYRVRSAVAMIPTVADCPVTSIVPEASIQQPSFCIGSICRDLLAVKRLTNPAMYQRTLLWVKMHKAGMNTRTETTTRG